MVKSLCLNKSNPYYKEWIRNGYSDQEIYQEYVLNNYFLPTLSSQQIPQIREMLKRIIPVDEFQLDIIQNLKKAKNIEATGAFFRNTLYFAKNANKNTVAEEAFHALMQELLTEDERIDLLAAGKSLLENRLAREARNVNEHIEILKNRLGLESGEANDYAYEEEVAKEFVNFYNSGSTSFIEQDINGLANKLSFLGDLAYPVAKFLANLFNKLKSLLNFSKDNQIALLGTFEKIKNGSYSNRKVYSDSNLYTVPSYQLYSYIGGGRTKYVSPAIVQKLVANVAFTFKKYRENTDDSVQNSFDKSFLNWFDYYDQLGTEEYEILADEDLREKLKGDIYKHLEDTGWQDEFNELLANQEDEIGGYSDFDSSANERDFSGYSREMKRLIQNTGKEISMIDREGNEVYIYQTPNPAVIYSGLVRAGSNTANQSERLQKLLKFSKIEGNENSNIFIEGKLLKDLVDDSLFYNNNPVRSLPDLVKIVLSSDFSLANISSDNSDAINNLNLSLNAFDLWSREMYIVAFNNSMFTTDESKQDNYGITQSFNSNQSGVVQIQLNIWTNNYNIITQTQDLAEFKKSFSGATGLSDSRKDIENNLFIISKNLGLNLNTAFVKDFVALINGSTNIQNLELEDVEYATDLSIQKSISSLKNILQTKSETEFPDLYNETEQENTDVKSLFRILASGNAKYDESILENSFQNIEKKTIYGFQWGTNTQKLPANLQTPAFIDRLNQGNPYVGQSTNPDANFFIENPITKWVTKYKDDKNALSNIKHLTLDGIKEQDTIIKKGSKIRKAGSNQDYEQSTAFGDLKYRDFGASLFTLFIEQARESKRISQTFVPVFLGQNEASKITDFISLPLLKNLVDESGNLTDSGAAHIENLINLEKERIDKISSMLLTAYANEPDGKITVRGDELQQRLNYNQDVWEKYHTGVFYKKDSKIDYISSNIRGLQVTKNLQGYYNILDYTSGATPDIKQRFTKVFNENLKELYQEKFISFNNKIFNPTGSLVPRDYYTVPTTRSTKDLGFSYTGNQTNDVKRNLAHVFLNMWLNSTYLNQLRVGDTVLNYKNDFADPLKRNRTDNAAGSSIATSLGNKAYGVESVKEIKYLIEAEPKATSDVNQKSLESADAQGTGSVKLHLKTDYGTGRLSRQKFQLYKEFYEGIESNLEDILKLGHYHQVKKTVAANGSSKIKLSVRTLNKPQTAFKTEISQELFFSQAEINAQDLTQQRIGSTLEVSWNLDYENPKYYAWEVKPGTDKLHNRRLTLEGWRKDNEGLYSYTGQEIDLIIHPTASKAGTKNVLKDYNLLSENNDYFTQTLDADSYKLQVENPAGKLAIYDPTQQIEISINELSGEITVRNPDGTIKNYPADELVDLFQGYLSARDKANYSLAVKEIFNGDKPHFEYFIAKLQDTLSSSGADLQQLEMLEQDPNNPGKMRFNQNIPLIKPKFMQLYFKHFSSGVLSQKVAGDALAMISTDGYTQLKKIVKKEVTYKNKKHTLYTWEVVKQSDPNYNSIVEKWRTNKHDLSGKIYDIRNTLVGDGSKDGVSNQLKEWYSETEETYFTDELRHNKPRIEQGQILHFSSEALMPRWYTESGDLKDNLRYQYGVRIPTQDKQSSVNIEWVDMLPVAMGNSIVVPKEVAQLAGSDFDIDKIFVHKQDGYFVDGDFKSYQDNYKDFKKWLFSHNSTIKALKKQGKSTEDILKQFELPTNEQEYKIQYPQGYTGFINNELLQLKQSLLSSDSALYQDGERGIYDSPATIDQLTNLADSFSISVTPEQLERIQKSTDVYIDNEASSDIKKVIYPFRDTNGNPIFDKENPYRQVYSPLNYMKYQNAVQVGKSGIAFSVNANLLGIIGNRLQLKSDKPVTISKILGGQTTLDSFNYQLEDGNRVFDVISTIITATTDEAKEGQLARHNIEGNGLKVIGIMLLHGASLGQAIALIQNPLVREFERLSNNQKIKTQDEKKDNEVLLGRPAVYEKITGNSYPIEQEYAKHNFTINEENLFAQVADNDILLFYVHLLNSFDSLSQLNPLIKSKKGFDKDTAALEKSVEKIIAMNLLPQWNPYITNIYNFRERILNNSKALHLQTAIANILDQYKRTESIFTERQVLFMDIKTELSSSVFRNVRDFNDKVNTNIDIYLVGQVIKYFGDKLGLQLLEASKLDANLLLGDNTVVKQLLNADEDTKKTIFAKYKIATGKSNANKNNKYIDKVSILQLGKVSPEEQTVLTDTFDSIYQKDKELAENLFRYFVVKDGFQFKHNSISKSLPTYLFEEISDVFDFILEDLSKEENLLERQAIINNSSEQFVTNIQNKKYLTRFKDIKAFEEQNLQDVSLNTVYSHNVPLVISTGFYKGKAFTIGDRIYKLVDNKNDTFTYIASVFNGNQEVTSMLNTGRFIAIEETRKFFNKKDREYLPSNLETLIEAYDRLVPNESYNQYAINERILLDQYANGEIVRNNPSKVIASTPVIPTSYTDEDTDTKQTTVLPELPADVVIPRQTSDNIIFRHNGVLYSIEDKDGVINVLNAVDSETAKIVEDAYKYDKLFNQMIDSFEEEDNSNISNSSVTTGSFELEDTRTHIGDINNTVIFENESGIYHMNNGQQKAYNFIIEKASQILSNKNRVSVEEGIDGLSDFQQFSNPISSSFSGVIPKEMYKNFIGIIGVAGTGKSSMIKKVINDLNNQFGDRYSGLKVQFLAPTHTAATVLQESLGINSESTKGLVETTQAWVRRRPATDSDRLELISEEAYIKDLRFNDPVSSPDILVIDESSMITNEFIKDLLVRFKTDYENSAVKMPVFIFLGDYRQLPPIEDTSNKGIKLGIISSTVLLNSDKTSELTQVMRSSDEYIHKVFDSVGKEIVKNIDNVKSSKSIERLSFSDYDALTNQSRDNILVVDKTGIDGVIDDYTEYLSNNNNPYGMFWIHYNRLDHPETNNLFKKIRSNYLSKLVQKGLVTSGDIKPTNFRSFVKGDYVEYTGGLPTLTKDLSYNENPFDVELPLVGGRYNIEVGTLKPRSRVKILDITKDKTNLKDIFKGTAVEKFIPNIPVDIETYLVYNRQDKLRALQVPYSTKVETNFIKKDKYSTEQIIFTNIETGVEIANFEIPYGVYKDNADLFTGFAGKESLLNKLMPSYIGSSHTAQGNSIKNVIVGDYNIKENLAKGVEQDNAFSSMYTALTRTSGNLVIIKNTQVANNQSVYKGDQIVQQQLQGESVLDITMYFNYDGNQRQEFKQFSSTFEAILAGQRTSTLRKKEWYKNPAQYEALKNLKAGNVITIWESNTVGQGRSIEVELTADAFELNQSLTADQLERLSQVEGWSVDYLKSKGYATPKNVVNLRYKVLDKNAPETTLAAHETSPQDEDILLTQQDEFYLHRGLYENGTFDDYQQYRRLSKGQELVGSAEDIKKFKEYIQEKDLGDSSDFNLRC